MADKVTKMVLKVDLQCSRCYKKIKKILQKFHEIRDQMFDEKENTVTITVDSYNPEKIRQKLCCKGVGIIKSVDIIEPSTLAIPNPPLKLEITGPDDPGRLQGQVKNLLPPLEPRPVVKPKEELKEPEKKKEPEKEKEQEKKKEPEKPTQSPEPNLVPGYPQFYPIGVIGVCCSPWYEGYGGGPCCYHGHGRPPPCYDGCGGSRPQPPYHDGCGCSYGSGCGRRRPCYDGCGCGCGGTTVYVNRCDQYLCDENPSACTVM